MPDLEDDVYEVESDDADLQETDDGGMIVSFGEEQEVQEKRDFYDNIADDIDPNTLQNLAMALLEAIRRDLEARKDRDKDYAQAMKRTGLGREAPGGAQFEGASRVVHPLLIEACVDFQARAIKELLPANGPVRVFIPGKEISQERAEKAERKKDYMNWQFLVQMPEFRSELEQLLMQLPLGGSMYMRLTPDFSKGRNRPCPTFVPLDDYVIAASASNFYSSERQTYIEKVIQPEFDQRVEDGIYRKVTRITSQVPEETEAEKANLKVQGIQPDPFNQDGQGIIYECSTWAELEDDVGRAPYLISIDSTSREIVSVIRNWEEDDEERERMQWAVEFQMFPWRGPYGVGLGQMIGSLSGAATGALRALLDSGHINNIPTLARLKGANFSGQNSRINATEVVEVDGGVAGNDIRQLLMPIPYKEPSEVLFQLLGFCVDAGKGLMNTAFEKLAEGRTDMPVGTTLALIEEGMRVMSSIHLRLYHSMTYLIRILHRIDRMYLTEEDLKNDIGEVLAHRADFEGPLDCVPTADPEIFSDVQRLAQLQIVADRAMQLPQLYNLRAVEKRLLERTKIPNPEELLVPAPEPQEMNAVNENAAMTLGRPVAAFPQQDHLAHLQVHLDFLLSPVFGQLPIIAQAFIPAVLSHIKEHLALWYVNETYEIVKAAVGSAEDGMAMIMQAKDPESRAELDRTLAVASSNVNDEAGDLFAQFPQIVAQAQQVLQRMGPQGLPQLPVDPNAQAETARKAQADQAKAANDAEKIQNERLKIASGTQTKLVDLQTRARQQEADRLQKRELEFARLSADERKVALQEAREDARRSQEIAARLEELDRQERAEDERLGAQIQSDEKQNVEDNLTALKISAAEIESSEKTNLTTGKGVNPNPSGGRRR